MTWHEDDPYDPGNPENKYRTRALQEQLTERLLAWGPLGFGFTREDYDCLISPLMHRLHDGEDSAALTAWLSHQLADHFGLGDADRGQRRFASELMTWWSTATAPPQ